MLIQNIIQLHKLNYILSMSFKSVHNIFTINHDFYDTSIPSTLGCLLDWIKYCSWLRHYSPEREMCHLCCKFLFNCDVYIYLFRFDFNVVADWELLCQLRFRWLMNQLLICFNWSPVSSTNFALSSSYTTQD